MANEENTTAIFRALTAKQREVLAPVADNRTSKEIAGLLGISESAVNQRIEIVRTRLGGLPRGELARLYRQECGIPQAEEPTWQKIHLPMPQANDEEKSTEGISIVTADQPSAVDDDSGNGSQLSEFLYPGNPHWLSRETRATAFVRGVIITGLVVAAIALAALVTQYLLVNLDQETGKGTPGRLTTLAPRT